MAKQIINANDRKKLGTGKLSQRLYLIGIVPLLIFGLIMLVLGFSLIRAALYSEVEKELQWVGTAVEAGLDSMYPGDYHLVGDQAISLYKGDRDITTEYGFIDSLHANSDLDISLFYADTRVQTTLRDTKGNRLVGTGAAAPIVEKVLRTGKPAFFHNTTIGGASYFCYYKPLTREDGSVTGMIAIAKPTADVNAAAQRVVVPLIVADLFLMLIISLMIARYTSRITTVWAKIHTFLREASAGNTSVELDRSVLSRDDELGSIGSSIVAMHRSMRDMMERDPLTHLFNRRSADRKFSLMAAKAQQTGSAISVAIGDIDFFKKVNDTYGHDAGDDVLTAVAKTLQEHMLTLGFVARWGGEEFLLVFDKMNQERVVESLETLMHSIRALKIPCTDGIIHVTMSFGVSTWDGKEGMNTLVKRADEWLYYSKTHGRNRVTATQAASLNEKETN